MKFSRSLHVIDSHTMGEPTRILTGGVPTIPGKTMPEKKAYLEEHMDYVRTVTMLEPRGHNDMFGAIITEPTKEEADLGIIFMDGGGYLNMCGHGTIGAAAVAVETGMIPVEEPYTHLVLEAPAGLVKAKVHVEDGVAKEVFVENVPSFLYKEDVKLDLPGVGEVTFDISFGGSFFAIIKDSELGVEIEPKNANEITDIALELRDIINETIEIQHPTEEHIKSVDLVEVYGEAKSEDADYQNVVVFGAGQVDRSPCGTGTSAKMATLHAKGELGIDEPFVYESIINTKFGGRVIKEVKIGDIDGIVPEVSGAAYITGFNHLVIDEDDPVKHGFLLR